MVPSSAVDPARPRFVVIYQDRRLPLPDGEFVVGRGLACHIRFNAAEVSRQHLKLVARGGRLVAENLSTTTGTLLNGRKITGKTNLAHGDELVLGPRRLRIEVEDVAGAAPPRSADESGEYPVDEATRPGTLADVEALAAPPAAPDYHTCPRCRARVDFGRAECASCSYQWSETHPSQVTGRATLRGIEPPEMTALRRDVPVVYASDELTIDAVVTDLDRHRAFVPSPLLDPNGTRCELTLLPDGIAAMSVAGVVTAVRSTTTDGGGIAGMEVRFTDVPAPVREWIERWLASRAK